MISPVKIWRRQKDIREILGKKGKVITWTKIFIPSPDFKKSAPYITALILLDSGKKVFGQLVDHDEKEIKMNMPVTAVLRKVRQPTEESVIAYGIKFKQE